MRQHVEDPKYLTRTLRGQTVALESAFVWADSPQGHDHWSARSAGREPLSTEDREFLQRLLDTLEAAQLLVDTEDDAIPRGVAILHDAVGRLIGGYVEEPNELLAEAQYLLDGDERFPARVALHQLKRRLDRNAFAPKWDKFPQASDLYEDLMEA